MLFIILTYSCENQLKTEDEKLKADTTQYVSDVEEVEIDSVASVVISSPVPESTIKKTALLKKDLTLPTESDDSLIDIFKQFEKKPQIFSIVSGKDTTIICKEGTKIKINANSFVSEKSGREIDGNVQISVKEYYKLSDIVFANLSTTAGKDILETGGMINITAKSNYEVCVLKKGKTVEISFPAKVKKGDMKLYTGNWENPNHINWTESKNVVEVVETQIVEEAPAFMVVEEMPVFPGGESAMLKFISENIKYPEISKTSNISGKVFVNFIVAEKGNIEDVRIIRGLDSSINKEVTRVIQLLPDWTPGRQRGKAVRVQITIPINFSLDGNSNLFVDWKPINEKINLKSDTAIVNAGSERLIYNVLKSSQLDWINCDRLWQQNKERINYIVSTEESKNTSVKIIFHKFKAVLEGSLINNVTSFYQVPLGEDITILAVIYKDNKPYLSIKNTKISNTKEKDLVFQPLNASTIKSEMEKIESSYKD